MKDRLSPGTNDAMIDLAKRTCAVLKENGRECYVVGGAVRDMIRGSEMHDIDIATNATPPEVMTFFSNSGKKVIPTGIDFGTVTVMMDGTAVEITTYRKDGKYSDFRHPDSVAYSAKVEDDLERRDFTINSMAYDPISAVLKDPHGGQKDLASGIIRAVGNPSARFEEDGLRMYRACRFSSKLGFSIDLATNDAIKENAKLAKRISVERIRDEILKTMESPRPSTGITCMVNGGLFDHVLPEVVSLKGVKQPEDKHLKDVYGHTLDVVDAVPEGKTMLRVAALFHDVAKPAVFKKEGRKITFFRHDEIGAAMFPGIGERLKLTGSDIDFVTSMIRNHMIEYSGAWSDAAVRRLVNRVGADRIDDLLALNEADYEQKLAGGISVAGRIRERIASMEKSSTPISIGIKDLKVNGRDVMAVLGIKPSPEVGRVLNRLLDAVISDPSLNEKAKLVDMMKSGIR